MKHIIAAAGLLGLLTLGMTTLAPPHACAQEQPTQDDTVDLNTADLDTIASLPGISKKLAQRILKTRDSKGAFSKGADLLKIKGFGRKNLRKIAGKVRFSQAAKAPDPPEAATPAPSQPPEENATGLRRNNRLEFDARLIRGQSAGAGAVFLFERAPRPLPPLLKLRTSWLDDTVRSTLGPGWTAPDSPNKAKARPKARKGNP